MDISFNCPHCPVHITVEIYEVLRTNFACNSCHRNIHPSEIFGEGKLDFHTEMARFISEAALCYYGHVHALKKAQREIKSQEELTGLMEKCHLYGSELMARMAIYLNDNETLQDIKLSFRGPELHGSGGSGIR